MTAGAAERPRGGGGAADGAGATTTGGPPTCVMGFGIRSGVGIGGIVGSKSGEGSTTGIARVDVTSAGARPQRAPRTSLNSSAVW